MIAFYLCYRLLTFISHKHIKVMFSWKGESGEFVEIEKKIETEKVEMEKIELMHGREWTMGERTVQTS